MGRSVNIYEAKTQLSRLVEQVEAGEEIVIARAGRPVARLVPYRTRRAPRTPGLWKGRVRLAPDFDATDEDLIGSFER
jgi:prevent-host-death family protein